MRRCPLPASKDAHQVMAPKESEIGTSNIRRKWIVSLKARRRRVRLRLMNATVLGCKLCHLMLDMPIHLCVGRRRINEKKRFEL